MIGTDEEEEVMLEGRIALGDKEYSIEGDEELSQGFAAWVDALVKKYSGGGWIRVQVNVEDPDYKAWSFGVSEEDYQQVLEKLSDKAEVQEA